VYELDIRKTLHFLRNAINSKFIRNVSIITSGTAVAQLLIVAFTPIITRYYGPEAFGLLGTFLAVVAVVTPVAALSYPIAIVLPKEDSDAKGIAKLSSRIAIGIASVITLGLLVSGDWLLGLLRLQTISSFILIIPLAMLFSARLQIAQQWLIRKKHFTITARVTVLNALILHSAITAIGFFKPIAAVLIVLSTVSILINFLMLVISVKKADAQDHPRENPVSILSQWELAKKYYDFPMYRSPQILLNTFSSSLPVLMLAAFFGPTAAGFYALCERALSLPGALIGNSVFQVFYHRITEAAHRGENIAELIVKATIGLASVGFVPFALVVAFGPWLFGFAFGKEWVVSGEYARWLALWIYLNFINRPSVAAVPVLGLQKGLLIYEFFSTGTKVIALYTGFILFKDDKISIALFSIVGAIAYLLLITWVIISSISFKQKVCYAKTS
jgi:O-antigen/teichoic acid export membrane protein